jgi:hypothetical protein
MLEKKEGIKIMMSLVGKKWSEIPKELQDKLLQVAKPIDRETGDTPLEGGACVVDFDSGLNAGKGEWLCIDGHWDNENNKIKIYNDDVFYNPQDKNYSTNKQVEIDHLTKILESYLKN